MHEAHRITVDVYEVIKTLQGLLNFTFEYPTRLQANKRKESLHLPEVQLMVLVVIATKLLFPFDRLARQPATAKEPGTQVLDWQLWVRAQAQFDHHQHIGGKLGKDTIIHISDTDVLRLEPQQLDEYMDWYENSWLDSPRSVNPVADLFPTSRAGPEEILSRSALASTSTSASVAETDDESNDSEEALSTMLRTVMKNLLSAPVNPDRNDEKSARPGQWYRRYRWESTLPETARAFYELASQLAGISLRTLIRAVAVAEWRIAHWQEIQRRTEYAERELELDIDHESGSEMDELDERLSELDVEEENV